MWNFMNVWNFMNADLYVKITRTVRLQANLLQLSHKFYFYLFIFFKKAMSGH